jgi:DNA-binding NtrC family response regulator
MEATTAAPPYPESAILIVDGDAALRDRLTLLFARAGLDNVLGTGDRGRAEGLVAERGVGLILLDLELGSEGRPGQAPGRDQDGGEALLREFSGRAPEIPVIVMTSALDPETVVRCMRAGAADYLVKPVDETRLFVSVWNAIASLELRREARDFRERVLGGRLEKPLAFRSIVTQDEGMQALFMYIESVAPSRQPVLITGETGTGKELFARAVHEASGRTGPFVAVNVAGLDDTMFSDSLFGHRKGAFTGAESQRAGLLKEAAAGTLLLDEIGDLDAHSQVKLLRLLQEGEYYPLGSDSPQRSDARIVAATTKDLRAATAAGSFRSDLFYRLQTHPVTVPPLREHPGDLSLLVRHFLGKSAGNLRLRALAGESEEASSDRLVRAFSGYSFPGNVRELESLVHDALAGARGGIVDIEALRARLGLEGSVTKIVYEESRAEGLPAPDLAPSPLASLPPLALALAEGRIPTIEAAERELMRMAVDAAGGNLSQAAVTLGVSRQTIYNKLKLPSML